MVLPRLMELSLFSFLGLPLPITTKLWGQIEKIQVIVMLDSEANNNFVESSVENKLHLKTIQIKKLNIMLEHEYGYKE